MKEPPTGEPILPNNQISVLWEVIVCLMAVLMRSNVINENEIGEVITRCQRYYRSPAMFGQGGDRDQILDLLASLQSGVRQEASADDPAHIQR